MSTRKALLMVGLGTIFASVASGGAPMGLPMASLGQGNWGAGAEYGHENMDLTSSGVLRTIYVLGGPTLQLSESVDIDDLAMNMFFVTLGYGVSDNWDVFMRLGVSDAQGDVTARDVAPITAIGGEPEIPAQYCIGEYDGNFGFAGGIGTRATLYRSGPWGFGALAQVTWFLPGDSDVEYVDPIMGEGAFHVGTMDLTFWQAQLSLAANYQIDTLRLWAGPFLQFIEGDLDRKGTATVGMPAGQFTASDDLQEKSQVGAHIGADWQASSQTNLWLEGQFTGDSWFVGFGMAFHPEETFGM